MYRCGVLWIGVSMNQTRYNPDFFKGFIEIKFIYCAFLQTNTTLYHTVDSVAEFPPFHYPTWLSQTWYARLGLTNRKNHNLLHYMVLVPSSRLDSSF